MTTSTVRRLYFYIAAFIGVQLLITGARILLSVLLGYLFLTTSVTSSDYLLELVSSSLAMLVVGLGLWAIHWLVAQRGIQRDEDRRSSLRRLYLYAVLVVSALVILFNLVVFFENVFQIGTSLFSGDALSTAIANILVHGAIFGYHWLVAASDRALVEVDGGPATLRRWYLVIVSAFGLGGAAWSAADLLYGIIQVIAVPAFGSIRGTTATAVSGLLAGLAVWLPNYVWGQRLLRTPGPLQDSEARSTLRQVYGGLVIVVSSVVTLTAMGVFLQEVLLSIMGKTSWSSVFADHLLALSTFIVGLVIWRFHQLLLADEARVTGTAASVATAHRMIVYLTAAVGLAALFFGLGGVLSTLLRWGVEGTALGDAQDSLALFLALSIVALPVYTLATRRSEQLALGSPIEERTLARRIYIYIALLFGIVTIIVAVVQIIRLALGLALGASEAGALGELGRWIGYALIGGVIGYYYFTLVRRAGEANEETMSVTATLIMDAPLSTIIAGRVQRDLVSVDLRVVSPDDIAGITQALTGADVLVTTLPALITALTVPVFDAFDGHRILLPVSVDRYDVVGAMHSDDGWAHETVRALREYAKQLSTEKNEQSERENNQPEDTAVTEPTDDPST